MAVRLGGNYLYFVMAMAGAGAITHSMVPPTPGPLMIADGLGLEIGEALLAGLTASILPVVSLYVFRNGLIIISISQCVKLRVQINKA